MNQTVNVTDSYAGPLGSVVATDEFPFASESFEYDRSEPGVGGTCTEYDNTATITETGASDSETVTVCVGLDLTVSKDAAGSYDREYLWEIFKNVDRTRIDIAAGGLATFHYTVTVNQTGILDSGWEL